MTQFENEIRSAADSSRAAIRGFTGLISNENAERMALQGFVSLILGNLQPDPEIDRAVEAVRESAIALDGLSGYYEEGSTLAAGRDDTVHAIDELERVILDRGRLNRRGEILLG